MALHRVHERELTPRDLGMIRYSDAGLSAFTAFAIVILCWAFLWYKNYNPLEAAQHYNLIFHDTANLNNNAAVYMKGVRVGIVERLEILNPEEVLVKVRVIPGKITIPKNAKFQILTNGLVGARYIDIVLPQQGQAVAEALPNEARVYGEDPVRVELAMNKLAATLEDVDVEKLKKYIAQDRLRIAKAADKLSLLADNTIPVLNRTVPILDEARPLTADIRVLTREVTKTSRSVNRLVNNPKFSDDMKETMRAARDTVGRLQAVMDKVQNTLGDKELRVDVLSALETLNNSTQHVEKMLASIETMAGDKELRTDVKEIVAQAKSSLDKVENLISNPGFGEDLRATLRDSRQALAHIDLAARQATQIMGKKAPLLHLLFGRPGKINEATRTAEKRRAEQASLPADTDANAGKDNHASSQSGEAPGGPIINPLRQTKYEHFPNEILRTKEATVGIPH